MTAPTRLSDLCCDIWQHVFEYLNAFEVLTSLSGVTATADEVLFNEKYRYFLRDVTFRNNVHFFPNSLLLDRVISLNLHQEFKLDVLHQCLQLRALRLTGNLEWIIQALDTISSMNIGLKKLTIIVSGISSSQDLLVYIEFISSLTRLEIYADESDVILKFDPSSLQRLKLQDFILHSSSPVYWNDLSNIVPLVSSVRFFDVTLFHNQLISYPSFTLCHLHRLHLRLIEVPFDKLIVVLSGTPFVVKLKLFGLVDESGYVSASQWLKLLKSSSCLTIVNVCVSLQESTDSFYNAHIYEHLLEVGLHLNCFDEDVLNPENLSNQQRWWNLSGTIVKQASFAVRDQFSTKKV